MSVPVNMLGRNTVCFQYTNWRGETELRRVVPDRVVWMDEPGYGYTAGWFLVGWDLQKDAMRQFSLGVNMDGKPHMRPFDERGENPVTTGRTPLSGYGVNILLQVR